MAEPADSTFVLFRLQLFFSEQQDLFVPDLSRPNLIRRAIEEKPTAVLGRGTVWHIGNLMSLERAGLYFAIGRTAVSQFDQIDANTGDFLTLSAEVAPFTPVIVDTELQVVAVAQNSRVAPKADSVARQLQQLLQQTNTIKQINAKVTISAIQDPDELLSWINSAYAVTKFQMSFLRPNIFDADDFQKPFQKLVAAADANAATTAIKGRDLSKDVLTSLTRAAAATGSDAKAWVKDSESSKPAMKQLKGNPACFSARQPDNSQDVRRVRCPSFFAFQRVAFMPPGFADSAC